MKDPIYGTIAFADVQTITKYTSTLELIPAQITAYNRSSLTDRGIRNSDGRFIDFSKKESFETLNILEEIIFEKLAELDASIISNCAWPPESQYLYYPTGGKFDWHNDPIYSTKDYPTKRLYSMVIELYSDYEGGGLEIKDNNDTIQKLQQGPGNYVIFPSHLRHRALEVTSGHREVLVVWIHAAREVEIV